MKPGVRVFRSASEASDAAAAYVTTILQRAVADSGRCRLVLSGGDTPRTLYQVLATRFNETVPWASAHIFWGDERYVAHDDRQSNYRMARETLLDHVPCPSQQIHPIPTRFTGPSEAAREYDRVLDAELRGGAAFDLVLLGLGADAHTASIFPGSPALNDDAHWALAVTAPVEPALRITLTMRALKRSRHIMVLAAGTAKAAGLRAALAQPADPHRHPAAGLVGGSADLTWWVDEPASALLAESEGREVARG